MKDKTSWIWLFMLFCLKRINGKWAEEADEKTHKLKIDLTKLTSDKGWSGKGTQHP